MKFTVIGHACLYIETAEVSIIVDPWLLGSAYWRSWWNFPPNKELKPEYLSPDYIYLTHHHFDHFHYPSMRRIDKRAHLLVRKFGVDGMPLALRRLGDNRIPEVPHGGVL